MIRVLVEEAAFLELVPHVSGGGHDTVDGISQEHATSYRPGCMLLKMASDRPLVAGRALAWRIEWLGRSGTWWLAEAEVHNG